MPLPLSMGVHEYLSHDACLRLIQFSTAMKRAWLTFALWKSNGGCFSSSV